MPINWANIFQYTPHAVGQPSSTLTPYASNSGASNQPGATYTEPVGEGNPLPGGWSFDIPRELQNIVSPRIQNNVGGNEGSTGTTEMNWNIDYSRLPRQGMTALGRVDQVAPVQGQTNMINPRLVVNDPVYGPITPAWNFREDTTSGAALMGRIVPAVAMSLFSGFMGAGSAGALARGAVSGARIAGGLTGGGTSSVANPDQAAGYRTTQNSPIMQLLRMILTRQGGKHG
jgi:hypothetical protein